MIEPNNLQNSKVMIYESGFRHFKSPVKFTVNEIVAGRILKILDKETAVISLKGHNFNARTLVPLKIGANMAFKVESLSPVPVLKPLGIQFIKPEAANVFAILTAVKENLWKTVYENFAPVKNTTPEKASYNRIVEKLPKKLFESGKAEYLKEIIDRSGLFLEAKLKREIEQKSQASRQIGKIISEDIKGLLSGFISDSDDKDAKQLLSAIMKLQILDLAGFEQDKKIFIPLPLLLPDGHFCIAQLLFQLPTVIKDGSGESAEEKCPLKISLLLEMSSLGPIRADFTLKGKMLYGMFKASMPDTVEILKNGIKSFIHNLEDNGFVIQGIECRLKEHEIVTEPLLFDIIQTTENTISLVG